MKKARENCDHNLLQKTKLTLRQRLMKLQHISDEEHCNEWGSLVVQTLRTTTYECYHGVFNFCLLQRKVAKHQTWRVSKTSTAWHLRMCHSDWHQLHLLLKPSGAPSNVALDWKVAVYSERPTMTARQTGRKAQEKIAAVLFAAHVMLHPNIPWSPCALAHQPNYDLANSDESGINN